MERSGPRGQGDSGKGQGRSGRGQCATAAKAVGGAGSAFGCDDRVLNGFSRQLQAIGLADVGALLLRCQFGAGLLGVGLQQLVDFLAAIHVCDSAGKLPNDIS